jgi:hypothetical protein
MTWRGGGFDHALYILIKMDEPWIIENLLTRLIVPHAWIMTDHLFRALILAFIHHPIVIQGTDLDKLFLLDGHRQVV